MTVCKHDFLPLGSDRIFCRYCGEFREAPAGHVCAPCLLPHGRPLSYVTYPNVPLPFVVWADSTVILTTPTDIGANRAKLGTYE